MHCTEVRFVSFLSGGFTTMTVINLPERKLAKRTSMKCMSSFICIQKICEISMWHMSIRLNNKTKTYFMFVAEFILGWPFGQSFGVILLLVPSLPVGNTASITIPASLRRWHLEIWRLHHEIPRRLHFIKRRLHLNIHWQQKNKLWQHERVHSQTDNVHPQHDTVPWQHEQKHWQHEGIHWQHVQFSTQFSWLQIKISW